MRSFFAWMIFASALGFLKLLLAAHVLSTADFGHYTSVLGGGLLASSLLSVGLVEGTIKLYPRLWQAGRPDDIRTDSAVIGRRLAARFAVAATLLCGSASLMDLGYGPLPFLLGAGVGLGTAFLALQASMIRAVDSASLLQTFSVRRAVVTLLAVCAGGWLFGWTGALAGEAVAAILTVAVTWGLVRSHFVRASRPCEHDKGAEEASGGGTLYVSMFVTSATTQLDRGLVNATSGPVMAGTYSFVSLLTQAGLLLMNILTQRVGPAVIRTHHETGRAAPLGILFKPVGLLVAVTAAFVIAALVLKRTSIYAFGFSRFEISDSAIMLAGALGMLSTTGLLEFWLIAENRERQIMRCSLVYAIIFFGTFAMIGKVWPCLEYFLLAACVAKAVHVAMLLVSIQNIHRELR